MWQICYTNWLLLPFSLGSRTLAWNYETSLPSTGFVYTYVYLLYSTCVFSRCGSRLSGISLSLKLCSIYTFDLQFTLVRVRLSKPSGLLLPPGGVLLGLTVARVWGGGGSFSPPHQVLSGLFGFVWPCFRSSFEIWFIKGGGRRPLIHLLQGCAFSPVTCAYSGFLFSFDLSPVRTLTNNC